MADQAPSGLVPLGGDRTGPTFGLAAKFWWSFVWRAAFCCLAYGLIIGILMAVLAALLKPGPEFVQSASTLAGILIAAAASVQVMLSILNRRYAQFRPTIVYSGSEVQCLKCGFQGEGAPGRDHRLGVSLAIAGAVLGAAAVFMAAAAAMPAFLLPAGAYYFFTTAWKCPKCGSREV